MFASAWLADVSIGPTQCDDVIVVIKSYPTHCGNSDLIVELDLEEIKKKSLQEYRRMTNSQEELYHLFLNCQKTSKINVATCIA